MRMRPHRCWSWLAGLGVLGLPSLALAQGEAEKAELFSDVSAAMFTVNNLWIMVAALLVFIMHLGFAMVEAGLTRAKNTVNILFKNTMIIMLGITMYAICGWMVMYPGAGHEESMIPNVFDFNVGIGGEGIYAGDQAGGYAYTGDDGQANASTISPQYNAGYTIWTDFLFQAMFAATCATIVSGAVAGRIRLFPFLTFVVLFVGLLYPMTGSWQWGGGWLADMGFADFAGSTLVHAVGGAGALAGAWMLGPRLGKYNGDGKLQPIPGHNMPLVTVGVFLLWFGWFGFNGGSELTAFAPGVSYVLMTTALAACGGGIAAGAMSWIFDGKPDVTMALNGILAGLVGITAGPDTPHWVEALVLVGGLSGVIVYGSVLILERLGIDDPVGAISVHGVCGIYGTLCVGLWGTSGFISALWHGHSTAAGAQQLGIQLLGTLACVIAAFVFAMVVFGILKATIGLRVGEDEEIEGLDLGEHDMAAYPDFQPTFIKSYHAREL